MTASTREQHFARIWRATNQTLAYTTQHRFARPRLFRFDVAFIPHRVAVEIHGGTRGQAVVCHKCGARVRARKKGGVIGRELRLGGRHNRGDGDTEKMNLAQSLGWIVLQYTEKQLDEQPVQICEQIVSVLKSRQPLADRYRAAHGVQQTFV